jgi:hypothetical protein
MAAAFPLRLIAALLVHNPSSIAYHKSARQRDRRIIQSVEGVDALVALIRIFSLFIREVGPNSNHGKFPAIRTTHSAKTGRIAHVEPRQVVLLLGSSLLVLTLTVAIPIAERRLFSMGRERREHGLGARKTLNVLATGIIQISLLSLGLVAFCAAWFSLLASFRVAPWEILWPCAAILVLTGIFGVAASISLFFKVEYQRLLFWISGLTGTLGFIVIFVRWVNS